MRLNARLAPELKQESLPTKVLQPSQAHRKRVKDVVVFSLRALENMYQDNCLRFCYTILRDAPRERVPSFRYTAITLLGLDAAKRSGLPVVFPVDRICTDLAIRAADETDLGNKALALWAALKLRSGAADQALHSLLAHDGFITATDQGLIHTTELAWAVYGLAMACADMNVSGGGVLGRNRKNAVKKRLEEALQTLSLQRNATTGLFQCAGIPNGNARLRDKLKTTSGFFDSQVYGAMALAESSAALEAPDLLDEAHKTVRALLKRQGPNGEWPWHYDIRSGAIIDPYPIFSVHQDGMGPMVLLDVGERLGVEFQEPVERSLQWVFGSNEIGTSMIDRELEVIWRGLGRKGIRRYILQASRLLHYGLSSSARLLNAFPGTAIIYECRPYHLGWLLYAFCRPSQLALNQTAPT
jgi:hypothetical protein